ncbi:NUDIX domain-containing protein [Streptomyces sp. NPDC048506]|uniref:NUDIX domain-containing protein n=1 Tax=Streptomyces sp. NPDC048506 TaxID=3155028 RepID=UPI00342DDD7D
MATSPRLEKITPGNFDAAIALKVRPDQDHLVAPVVKSLAEAYVHPDVAWPRLILDGDRLVGFLRERCAPTELHGYRAPMTDDQSAVTVDSGVEIPLPADGEVWAVGAVVLNADGKAFVQKRGPERRLFPDCWDIVGGHVEPGESLLDTLAGAVAVAA